MFGRFFLDMDTTLTTITDAERAFAIQHLTQTGKAFIDSIRDMTEQQWYMRPGPGQWSASECADHLMQTEAYFFMPTIQKMLSEPADPARRTETAGKDEAAIASMENRSYKIKGQPWDESAEKKIDKEALMADFQVKRKEVIDWLSQTQDPLRVHYTSFPGLDTIDVYQFILMISAHTTRHTGQIEDIKELDFYPKAVGEQV
jgi:hypothetical protein